jgi:hypothetical protein
MIVDYAQNLSIETLQVMEFIPKKLENSNYYDFSKI